MQDVKKAVIVLQSKESKAFSLNKSKTCRSKQEFDIIFKEKTYFDSYYARVYIKKDSIGKEKFGIIASKKCGNAIQRNKCKRRLREIYRLNQNYFAGHSIIFIAKRALIMDNYKKVEEKIKRLFEEK